jgi:hypothetical protein
MLLAGQVVLLSVPVPGQPLTASAPPTPEAAFARELVTMLRPMDRSAGLPRVPSFHDRILPYELRALETALSAAVRTWEHETLALEKRIRPTLSSLLNKVRRHPQPLLETACMGAVQLGTIKDTEKHTVSYLARTWVQ